MSAPQPFVSAALLGRGSEVLGFDDEMSGDHNWEPRVLLFLRDEDYTEHGSAVGEALRNGCRPRGRDRSVRLADVF